MKLKYLLPVATVASVATIVTPLVTSCGAKWDYSWNYKKDGSYHSKVTQAPSTLSEDKLTQTYFDDLANNHEILPDDAFCAYNDQYEQMTSGPMKDFTTINSFIAKVNITNVDTKSHLLSMRYLVDLDAKIEIPDDDPVEMKIYTDISVKNIEYNIVWYEDPDLNEEDEYWQLQTTVNDMSIDEVEEIIEMLNKHEGWSLSGKYGMAGGSAGEKYEIYNFDFNKSKLPSSEKDIEAFMVSCGFEIPSHYLAKVPHQE